MFKNILPLNSLINASDTINVVKRRQARKAKKTKNQSN